MGYVHLYDRSLFRNDYSRMEKRLAELGHGRHQLVCGSMDLVGS